MSTTTLSKSAATPQRLRSAVKRRTTFDTARAEALFASRLQPSDQPTAVQVRAAITVTLHALGIRGCAARLAEETGEHPEASARRMSWAIAVIRSM
ncbi:hypothetical protein [Paractinoplanes atraurantiacus]|uniref:Uncharacterized protein n=1 Tax=Paractinoplanes atraurantiacus TaxID=1036182 RepID=A0A285K2F1_9ACTN|nr:hypothetical protein [Actinoplanes atraurantiacus]SNY66197.1 hypothetical protein SAMN05421748_129126 [Actinoplanes atraurantiacus]